jgi:hypothetical protein
MIIYSVFSHDYNHCIADEEEIVYLRNSSSHKQRSPSKPKQTTPLHRIAGAGLLQRLIELLDSEEVPESAKLYDSNNILTYLV